MISIIAMVEPLSFFSAGSGREVIMASVRLDTNGEPDRVIINFYSSSDEEKYYKFFPGVDGKNPTAQHGLSGEILELSEKDSIIANQIFSNCAEDRIVA